MVEPLKHFCIPASKWIVKNEVPKRLYISLVSGHSKREWFRTWGFYKDWDNSKDTDMETGCIMGCLD